MPDVLPESDELTEILLEALAELPASYKAEIVDEEIHVMSPTGRRPSRAAANVYVSLRREEGRSGGQAHTDNIGYFVRRPIRRSFSPDASFTYNLPAGDASDMKFIPDPPAFAVEVRSESDYGPRAEARLARKRADYFAVGTRVVWDVDLLGPDTIRVYRADRPDAPDVYRRGETAEAEPAVPGWRFPVDELFA